MPALRSPSRSEKNPPMVLLPSVSTLRKEVQPFVSRQRAVNIRAIFFFISYAFQKLTLSCTEKFLVIPVVKQNVL